MKKITTYWLLAAAMTLAGCASDNDIAPEYAGDENDAVTINATRVATSTSVSSTALAEGETFCLVNETRQSLGRTNKYKAVYEVTSSGIVPQESAEYVVWQTGKDKSGNEITQNTFRAVIPDDAPLSNFQLPTDQSTADKLKSADWLLASDSPTVTAMQTKPTLSLNFEHQMSKLHFTITSAKDDATDLSSNSFSVFGLVTPYYNATAQTVEAIIDPKLRIPTTTPIIIITTTDNEPLSVPIPSEITGFEAGKQYNFNLAIGHDVLTISSVSVTDWTSEPINMESSDAKSDQYDYVTFTAEGEQGFKFVVTSLPGEITEEFPGFEYSVDNGEWKSLPATGMTDEEAWITFGGTQGTLRLRGKNPYGTAAEIGYARVAFKDNDVNVACSGDIRTLIDYDNYANVDTKNARFVSLFEGCKSLTTPPALPATTLADFCYLSMFKGCTSLTTAPALPATTLAAGCYSFMFSNCSALTTVPEVLPATELAASCYSGMFYGCTSLTSAPKLPATVLASSCYMNMFFDCTSLTSAPELPATTLASECYCMMFCYCTSLTKAPELPAQTLYPKCYYNIFNGCKKISEIKMLAPSLQILTDSMDGWLYYVGTDESVTSRKLIVDSQEAYNELKYYARDLLPDEWKATTSGATVVDKNGNAITDN